MTSPLAGEGVEQRRPDIQSRSKTFSPQFDATNTHKRDAVLSLGNTGMSPRGQNDSDEYDKLERRLRALEKSREKTERTIEREVNSSWLTCDLICTCSTLFAFALCSGLTRPVFLPSAAGCTAARTVGEGPGCRPPP